MLDEIDMRDWKSFMEWCGSRAEEFGDWPDKLSVSAYTRYVDQYHEKVLEINEMTRQQVNTVFENVAEIDARYAARLREHREKVKEQIAIVKTMTEFMDSMSNGNPNMALLSGESVNKAVVIATEKTKSEDIRLGKLPDRKVIQCILEKANGKLDHLSLEEIETAKMALKMLVSASQKDEKGYTRRDIGALCMLFKDKADIWKIVLGGMMASCVMLLNKTFLENFLIGMYVLIHASRTKVEEADYVGVYYLNKEDGAFGQGHPALLFVREDGSGVYYSFAGNAGEWVTLALTMDVTGYMSRTELTAEEVGVFFTGPKIEEYLANSGGVNDTEILTGKYPIETTNPNEFDTVPCEGVIFADYMGNYIYEGGNGKPYNRTIYIPLSDEQGDRMVELAEELRRDTPDYNFLENNCGMVAQQILAEGGVDFAATSGSAWDERIAIFNGLTGNGIILCAEICRDLYFNETKPNIAYAHGEEMAEENGYAYGSLDDVYREVNGGSENGDTE